MGAVAATFRTAVRDAWANRRSFWVQVCVMVANDLAWVLFWVLLLPVPTLPYLLARRIDTALLGDLFFGPLLFLASGRPSPERVALFVAGALCGASVLVGFLV